MDQKTENAKLAIQMLKIQVIANILVAFIATCMTMTTAITIMSGSFVIGTDWASARPEYVQISLIPAYRTFVISLTATFGLFVFFVLVFRTVMRSIGRLETEHVDIDITVEKSEKE